MRTTSTPTDEPRRPIRRTTVALALAAVLALAAAGCGDDGSSDESADGAAPATEATTTTVNPLGGHGPNRLGCVTRAPGEPLSRDEAIVRFTPEQVCPGYVTVVVGTPVTWVNEDDGPHVVTVQVMAADGTLGETVIEQELAPGDYVEQELDEGLYSFSTDALPAFRGTVEVQAAGEASSA